MLNPKVITVYEPNYRSKHDFFKTLIGMVRNIWKSRFLIQQLFVRDFLAVYKKSFFGIAWLLISPIAGIVSWVFLQKSGMLNPGELEVPYPAYILMGITSWSFFEGVFNASTRTLSSGKSLVMQVNYPHEALLIKELAQFLSNFSLKFLMVIVVLLFIGVVPSWKVVFFPLVCLPAFFLATGFGLIVSLFVVITDDILKITGMAFKLFLWTTPIIYGSKVDNEYIVKMIEYNPLTYIVCSMRDIVLFGEIYGGVELFYCLFASFLFFLYSWRFFYVSEQQLIERMI